MLHFALLADEFRHRKTSTSDTINTFTNLYNTKTSCFYSTYPQNLHIKISLIQYQKKHKITSNSTMNSTFTGTSRLKKKEKEKKAEKSQFVSDNWSRNYSQRGQAENLRDSRKNIRTQSIVSVSGFEGAPRKEGPLIARANKRKGLLTAGYKRKTSIQRSYLPTFHLPTQVLQLPSPPFLHLLLAQVTSGQGFLPKYCGGLESK